MADERWVSTVISSRRDITDFHLISKLGFGAYGTVYKAEDIATDTTVAIKLAKDIEDPQSLLPEIQHLADADHHCIIKLCEVIVVRGSLAIVMEYADANLWQHAESLIIGEGSLAECEVKRLVYMLLHGLMYLHDKGIIHCDVEPDNLLVMRDGMLKIADLGMCRRSPRLPKRGELIATRWYRAPELTFEEQEYTTAVDIWAAGCVMGELLAKQPLFPAADAYELWTMQVVWLLEEHPATKTGLKDLSADGLDLLKKLLQYDPTRRVSAERALMHRWFSDVRL